MHEYEYPQVASEPEVGEIGIINYMSLAWPGLNWKLNAKSKVYFNEFNSKYHATTL